MDTTPDDILRLIFDAYAYRCSPANLLRVCRRWHILLVSSSKLWTRVRIVIDSFTTIPHILGNLRTDAVLDREAISPAPLLVYLERSVPTGSPEGLPLDIKIIWKKRKKRNEAREPAISIDNAARVQRDSEMTNNEVSAEDEDEDGEEDDTREEDEDEDEDEEDEEEHEHVCQQQTQELVSFLAGDTHASSHAEIANFTMNFGLKRCKSLSIDMEKALCELCYDFEGYDIDLGPSEDDEIVEFPTLETIVAHNIQLYLRNIGTPSLRTLEVHGGDVDVDVDVALNLRALKKLRWYNCYQEPLWEEYEGLKILQICGIDYYNIQASHSFPHLSNIIFHQEDFPSDALRVLSNTFNKSRPLRSLVLAVPSLTHVLESLQEVQHFHTQRLQLSSRLFRGRIRRKTWNWWRFVEDTWEVRETDVEAAVAIQLLAKKRGMKVRLLDAQMKFIWEEAKKKKVTGKVVEQKEENSEA